MTPQERKSVIERIASFRKEIACAMEGLGDELTDFADEGDHKRYHTLMLAANRQAAGMDKMLSQLAKKLAKAPV
jgi:hypothetical protein